MTGKRARSAGPTSRSTSRRRASTSSAGGENDDTGSGGERKRIRHGTLFDAVAGRLTTSGFLASRSHQLPSKHRDTLSHGRIPLRPGEALFRHPHAPERFEEDDVYSAHRHLRSSPSAPVGFKVELPSSDLLVALHAYASDFYRSATTDRGGVDWKSMDETALLAFGVLIEEEVKAILGDAGDLVFVEGEAVDEESEEEESEEEEEEEEEEEYDYGQDGVGDDEVEGDEEVAGNLGSRRPPLARNISGRKDGAEQLRGRQASITRKPRSEKGKERPRKQRTWNDDGDY